MSKIYVPNYEAPNCAAWVSSDTIRVFDSMPTLDNQVSYIDYYINSHYLSSDGIITYTDYNTIPLCITSDNITTDFYYRNDLSDILVCFIIIVIFCIYFPYRLFSRMFGRWLKL